MAPTPPYVNAYGNIAKALVRIQAAATPSRFSQDFLATMLGMKGGSARAVIPYLKRIGFLSGDGQPTELYKQFRNPAESASAARQALQSAYSSLYEVNEYAHELSDEGLRGIVVQVTGIAPNSSKARSIVGSFKALREFASFAGRASESPTKAPSTHLRTSSSPAPFPPMARLRRRSRVDHYRLVRRLGRGYSAEVWLCEVSGAIPGVALEKGDQVAVKFYELPQISGIESLRIQREFGIAVEADHENLARVYDVMLSTSRPNHTFMAMEYVPGPTLKAYIQQEGPLAFEACVGIGRQLFAALEELHSLGAIHRDVKAANILCQDPTPTHIPKIKLVDLGIVYIAAEQGLTQASSFLGSKHSAPFEQLVGDHLDERADIYGVGSVLFSCLMGRELYAGAGPEGAIVRQMLQAPEALEKGMGRKQEFRFIEFVNACISVDKKLRPKTASDCLGALDRWR